jgi:uncharacterized protein (TIGR02147 family)
VNCQRVAEPVEAFKPDDEIQAVNNSDFFSIKDFRLILRREFDQRNKRRPAYTLNAFARDIGFSASRLSGVLQGRYGISGAAAKNIAKTFGFDSDQTGYFCDLIQSEHARSSTNRKEAALRLMRYQARYLERHVDDPHLELFSNWYTFAVHELIKIHSGKISADEIAKKLRLTKEECRGALQTLTKHGLVTGSDKVFTYIDGFVTATRSGPNTTIKNFHKQFLNQASEAIERVPMKNRKNRSTILTFDKSRTEEARVWLESIHREFIKEFGSTEAANSVFGLGVYLFPLEGDT